MEVLTRLLPKLAELLVGEYNLQKEVKGGIIFLQAELEHMKAALEKISSLPADQIDSQDKIWTRDVRELSYVIEDKVDTFMVRCKGTKPGKNHGFKKVVDRSLDLLMQPKIRRKIATDIRDIKSRVKEVAERRDRYKFNNNDVPKPIQVDPRLFTQYEKVLQLVGIDEARDEVIKFLGEENEESKMQDKIVSIVGFGGLGKTTLANVVYEKLRPDFACSAFVSVSQTVDMDKIFKEMLRQVSNNTSAGINVIDELREFLMKKRYLVVVDDIWDITTWKMIRCALPCDNVGCKIITTTRIRSVAEHAGNTYTQKPLSTQNSRKLLYERIFGSENRETNEDPETCPDKELAEVSDKIIKKCAGVPLAIITIASLLANKGRNKILWYEVYNSIGTGMENSLDAANMRKILSYSYYDLPSHLRTCLLYVSMFLEDSEIRKDHLIWLWIAEGFIQPGEQGKSLFNIGESYFNELINRSMIQLLDAYRDEEIKFYCVHDMVLDLICSISSEENFVTILTGNMHHTSPLTMVRRLSLQNCKGDNVMTQATRSMTQVRSVFVVPSAFDQMPALRNFKVLRVLDLRGCDLSQGYSVKYLGSLFHLRYLNLTGTGIGQLPEEVGKLQFLETLDVLGSGISRLPPTIAHLTHLLCLSIDEGTTVPNGIGSLTSLEDLSRLLIINDETTVVEELGFLTELRVLHIGLVTNKWAGKLMESVSKLRKIQRLYLSQNGESNMGGSGAWISPRNLRSLDTQNFCRFSRLPAWMNDHSHLQDLSSLSMAVTGIQQEDLEILGRLPVLHFLDLLVDHEDAGIAERFVVAARLFSCLERCRLWGFVRHVVFQQGSMPRLRNLDYLSHVWAARGITGSYGSFDVGLGNLPSLQYVRVCFRSEGASEEDMVEARAALTKSVELHPNRPTLELYG